MSNDLKWHLLKETSDIILESIKRTFSDSLRQAGSLFVYPNVSFLGTWFMSGKESAAIVRMILSQLLAISGNSFTVRAKLSDRSFAPFTIPNNVENLALRWARFLQISDFQRSPEFSSFVQTLREHNCIEELSLKTNEHLSVDDCIAIVEVCPYLSTLTCSPDLLVSLLEHVKAPVFSKMHSIETTKSANDWSLFFENLKNHAEQCPVLETLTMKLDINDLKTLSKLVTNSLSTIKSYNIRMKPDNGDPIDFPLIATTWQVFPNLETASVTADVEHDVPDPIKLIELYKSFEKFNPKVEFTFEYTLDFYDNYSETQVDELEIQLRTWGTITSVSRDSRHIEYSVATSYPNKTLKLTLGIYVDEEAEDFEDDDDAEDSEEDSEIGDDDEEGFEVGDAEQDSEEDFEDEDSDGEPEKKRMKLV